MQIWPSKGVCLRMREERREDVAHPSKGQSRASDCKRLPEESKKVKETGNRMGHDIVEAQKPSTKGRFKKKRVESGL